MFVFAVLFCPADSDENVQQVCPLITAVVGVMQEVTGHREPEVSSQGSESGLLLVQQQAVTVSL